MSGPTNGYERPKPSDRPMDARLRPDDGLPAAGQVAPHGGYQRAEFFQALKIPMQNGVGKKERS
jgi:hypothetical protein